MQLFYHSDLQKSTEELFFSREESQHLIKSLRKKVGDVVYLTNGKGMFAEGKITLANPKKCILNIVGSYWVCEDSYRLHLAIAPTKSLNRFEWFLEKATEIGVHQISPIQCTHSERKTLKLDRCKKIMQSAMKQSHRAYLPQIKEFVPFEEFIKNNTATVNLIAHCAKSEKKSIKEIALLQQDILLLIGPEGDFSDAEILLAKKHGFTPISIGNHRLRTETAAVTACQIISYIHW